MISEFNTYLDGINSELWKELCMKHGELRSFRKGEEFIRIGEVAKYIGFITKGSVKYIVYTTDDKEKVIGLETVGGFAASFPYCLRGLPSEWSVVANTDSELYCISTEKIKELIRNDSDIKQCINETLEVVFYDIYNRHIELYALSSKERYEKLLSRCPQLFEIFQLKDIASYLNITPQHLRRLKK